MKTRIAEVFRAKTRDEWCEIMEQTDVCFAPVLSMEEATGHPHNVARNTFIDNAGMTQAAPAPRFSRTEAAVAGPAAHAGEHTEEVLCAARSRRFLSHRPAHRRPDVGGQIDGGACDEVDDGFEECGGHAKVYRRWSTIGACEPRSSA
jgi:hypothetical protein